MFHLSTVFLSMPHPLHPRRLLLLLALTAGIASARTFAQGATPATLAHARNLRSRGDLAAAAAALNALLSANPEDVSALTELARVRLDQADPTAAEPLLSRALAASPNSPEANDLFGALLLQAKHYPEAMDRFEITLAIDPHDGAARDGEFKAATTLALATKAAGNGEAALLCLTHAAEHLPGNVDLLTDIGIVAGDLHLFHRADQAFTEALAIAPEDTRALYAAGRVATDAQHLPAAGKYLRAYLALKPNDATAHFGLGRVLAMQLDIDGARAEFERSVALQPLQSESYYQLGVLAADAHSDADAETLFHKTLARDPHHGGALTALGQIAYRRKQYTAAQTSLAAAILAAPAYQPAHYYLGLTLARLGQTAASAHELERATQLTAQQQSKAAPEPGEAASP